MSRVHRPVLVHRTGGRGVRRVDGLAVGLMLLLLFSSGTGAAIGEVPTIGSHPNSTTSSSSIEQFQVNFSATGLSGGTSWSVNLSGTSESAQEPWILFVEPNGTYPYAASTNASGSLVWENGSVHVSGVPAQVSVSFGTPGVYGPAEPGTAPPSESAAGSGGATFWIEAASIGTGLVGLGALIVVAVERRRRPPRPGEPRSSASAPPTKEPPAPSDDDPLGHML